MRYEFLGPVVFVQKQDIYNLYSQYNCHYKLYMHIKIMPKG